ncbi:hypothetical protein PILCRDRAFT_93267 [Piloderma croceum F 1598]|uniref:Uncharacterized protein n=1 Tax=Piloderma croceum (strain F 1598) TaxID=765440 RepID=A0A0C3AGM1_PILCF|nr:hypothetical protein PILCRDRAFT_93267 [Piloderma croceum F 1598]
MSQSLSQSLDQPAPTQSTADNDDYPGDEELSRMDLSHVDVLNNSPSNAHALPTFMSPQTPARQLFRNQTSPPQGLEPQTLLAEGLSPELLPCLHPKLLLSKRLPTKRLPAKGLSPRILLHRVSHPNLLLSTKSAICQPAPQTIPANTETPAFAAYELIIRFCRFHSLILHATPSEGGSLCCTKTSKEHNTGVQASMLVAIGEAHALDWLTRGTTAGKSV